MVYLTRDDVEPELPFGPESLGIDDTETDSDGNTAWDRLIQRVIGRESERIDEWTRTTFETTEVTETLDGGDTDELPLSNRPVQSVTSLEVTDDSETHTLDTAADIYVAETHVELLDEAPTETFPERTRNVSITYTYGYDSLPGPVEEALVRLVRHSLDQIETDGLDSDSEGGFSYTYTPSPQLRADILATVKQYRPESYYGGVHYV